jgi:hypothetical protein
MNIECSWNSTCVDRDNVARASNSFELALRSPPAAADIGANVAAAPAVSVRNHWRGLYKYIRRLSWRSERGRNRRNEKEFLHNTPLPTNIPEMRRRGQNVAPPPPH